MADLVIKFVKYAPSLAAIFISALALWQRWIIKTDRLFEKYSKLSDFAFQLYQKSGDAQLEKISKEYGYAAITREKNLSHAERCTLLKMVNPINGIEEYHKCADYLKVSTIGNCFIWKNKRHRNKTYRLSLKIIFFTIYIIGSIMLFSPVFYSLAQHSFIGTAFKQLPPEKKFWVTTFIMVYGAILFFISLNKLAKLSRSAALIKNTTLT